MSDLLKQGLGSKRRQDYSLPRTKIKPITKMKAENLISSKGNPTPNQFRIITNEGVFFQSYSSIIVHVAKDGSITLDEKYWDYSKTTRKYRNDFLSMDSKQIKEGIKSGKIQLKNLNRI